MPRVSMNSETSPAASQPLLEQIDKAFGTTPNMFKAVSNSPAALKSMWGAFGALAGGTLGARLGEQIAVAIANRNRCEYCLAAHTVLGRNAGASMEDMAAAQVGKSEDPRTAAAIAAMCSGVVPQHPPTRLIRPLCANSRRVAAMSSGVSS